MSLIREVSIENYKSIRKTKFSLGRVNVLIGANGSGKSNVLEAIALACARARGKDDDEYIVPRGIRVTEPRFMRSAFEASASGEPTALLKDEHGLMWPNASQIVATVEEMERDPALRDVLADPMSRAAIERLVKASAKLVPPPDFLIFAPENSLLKSFQPDTLIRPLGVRGDGLFAHLKDLSRSKHAARLTEIGDHLALLDWFDHFEIPKDLAPLERSILIRDRYLAEGALFDQRSANEGFLFLLFYFTLLISPDTPSFFAIDNIDTSLNPKLCTRLTQQIVKLTEDHHKQVLLTTHNPSVLDGLDLHDDEQRLFVTERRKDGGTRVVRVDAPKPFEGRPTVKLSEAFVRGYLGGLPKNF